MVTSVVLALDLLSCELNLYDPGHMRMFSPLRTLYKAAVTGGIPKDVVGRGASSLRLLAASAAHVGHLDQKLGND